MTPSEADLRRASDTLLSRLDRLAALETEKRTLTPGNPRALAIASEVEGLAAAVLEVASKETDLAERARSMVIGGVPDAPTRSIEETPRPLVEVLDEWRAAERELASAAPGSPEAAEASFRARGLRAEYQRTFEEASRKRLEG